MVTPSRTAYPVYRCHKVVRAFQLGRIETPFVTGALLCPTDPTLPTLDVEDGWLGRHHPEVGGYVVFYEDGYTSYSPPGPFEAGYTRISE